MSDCRWLSGKWGMQVLLLVGSFVWVQGDIQRGVCTQAVLEVRLSWASSMFSSSCPKLGHIPSLQSRPPLTAVHTVGTAGMSLLITKSPPSPPCFFSNHAIKEMSALKPYPACFSYTQLLNLGLLLVAFHSRLLRSLFTSVFSLCKTWKASAWGPSKEKTSLQQQELREASQQCHLYGNIPSFSWKWSWKKSSTWTLPNPWESCCSGQKRSALPCWPDLLWST